MDLSELFQEPKFGKIESDSPQPLDELDEKVQAIVGEVGEEFDWDVPFTDLINRMLEIADDARSDFQEPLTADALDSIVSDLIDGSNTDDTKVQQALDQMGKELSSLATRSLVRHLSAVSGIEFSLDRSSSPADWVRQVSSHVRRSFDEIGSSVLKQLVYEFLSSSYGSIYQAWVEWRSERVDDRLPTEPNERVLELKVRDLEFRVGEISERAYSVGWEWGRLSPSAARDMLRLVDELLGIVEAILRGLDLFLALSALRIRAYARRWEDLLRQQIEGIMRQQLAQWMSALGTRVLSPILQQVHRLQLLIDSIERLIGAVPELDVLDTLFDQVMEWQRQYISYLYSLRNHMVQSAEVGVGFSIELRRYEKLWRRRRLASVLARILRAVRDGLREGLVAR